MEIRGKRYRDGKESTREENPKIPLLPSVCPMVFHMYIPSLITGTFLLQWKDLIFTVAFADLARVQWETDLDEMSL